MLTRIRTQLFFILITGATAILVSCNQVAETSEEVIEATTPVTIVPVTFKSVTSTVDLPAVSMFMNKSIIRATITGIIEKISVNPGDYISNGQQIFSIRTREAMALNKNHNSDSSLIFNGLINISSHKEGVISSVSFQKSDFVQEGDELAVVSEQNSLVFILEVPFELNRLIEKNINCSVTLPDTRIIKGTITGKLPEMDIQSQTIRYIVRPFSVSRLPANLIATIRLIKSTSDNALVLPKKAVLGDETQSEFWVMKLMNDSTAVKVVIRKGFENSDEVEITEPKFLSSDKIVLTGNYGLADTARIEIIEE
ncbi:MAG TPA: HlyD family efflux transporter periplasmic adaptor subunit [Bacteroidales bacterium]|nr:HlyD family efflux transporter periplasmic adaptor subunit [Bacteroidales bacterium]